MSSFQTILAGLRDVSERVLQELSTLTVTVSGVVSALDKAKADKVTLIAFTIPTTGWQQDGNYGYPYYVDLPVSGLTENDVVAVEITPAGQNVAETACFLSSSESLSGVLRLRAKHIPTAALAAYYYIIREDLLMAFGPLAVGTTPYTLPAATATTLGGVKVGDYLDIAPDGTLSAKTLNDKIAAAVAVKSEPRLVWNHYEETGKKWKTYDIKMLDGLDYVHVKTKYNSPTGGYGEEVDIAKGGTANHSYGNGTGIFASNTTFQTNGTLHFATETSTGGYTVEIWLTGYHYPTLAELLTETQAAQADTDALAVDQEYRLTLLEAGVDPTIT